MGDIISGCTSECGKCVNLDQKSEVDTESKFVKKIRFEEKYSFKVYMKNAPVSRTNIFSNELPLHSLKQLAFEYLRFVIVVKLQRFYRRYKTKKGTTRPVIKAKASSVKSDISSWLNEDTDDVGQSEELYTDNESNSAAKYYSGKKSSVEGVIRFHTSALSHYKSSSIRIEFESLINKKQGYKQNELAQITYSKSQVFKGKLSNSLPNGVGLLLINSDSYCGDFVFGALTGMGFFQSITGASFEGCWKNGMYHGYGIECWNDMSYYKGEFRNGVKSGYGSYFWREGTFYEGQIESNQPHGWVRIIKNK